MDIHDHARRKRRADRRSSVRRHVFGQEDRRSDQRDHEQEERTGDSGHHERDYAGRPDDQQYLQELQRKREEDHDDYGGVREDAVTTTEDADDRRTNAVAFTVDGARGSSAISSGGTDLMR